MSKQYTRLARTKQQMREFMHDPLPEPLESAFAEIEEKSRATRFLHPIPRSQQEAFARIDRDWNHTDNHL